ncbi:putative lipoprotein with Yx(FWY)xxD motif [Catenulispora sp. GP43]|uniref:COG4315 family predicted lipoprotein n=1 Tax=Catenulispora sp. GP43 TaxID=3156263 RepID=UPI003515BCAE
MFRSVLAGGGLAAAAVLLAACGGSSSPASSQPAPSTSSTSPTSPTSPSSSSTGTAPPAAGAAVSLGSTSLGMVLVNEQGFTLYLFQADTPTMSACSGACAAVWPPATATGTPVAGPGLTPSLLTTLTRSDGSKQLVYNGHPLYTYAGDNAAGQTAGEGNTSFGAGWFAVNAGGNKV